VNVTIGIVEKALQNVESRLDGWSIEQVVADDIRRYLRDPDVEAYKIASPCTRANILRGVYHGANRCFAGEPTIQEQDNGMVRVFAKRCDRYCVFNNCGELLVASDGQTPNLFGPLTDNEVESCVLTYLSGYINNAQEQKEHSLPEYKEVKAMLTKLGVQEGKYKLSG